MRLFVEADNLIGDTLMQTPAIRQFRRLNPDAEIVYVTPEGSVTETMLRGNPHIDRFARQADGPTIKLSAWDALQYGIQNHKTLIDGFAHQLGVTLPQDGYQLDLRLTDEEKRAGEALMATIGTNYKVVVCARHSTSCGSNDPKFGRANKCFPNEVWVRVANWLLEEGYIPLAVGGASEADDPRYAEWPGPRLYGQPLRTMAALIARAKATLTVDTGIRFIAAATGCDLACISGEIPIWLINAPPIYEDQTVVETLVPVQKVNFEVCQRVFSRIL